VPTVASLKQILIHETVHAYDYCTKNFDLNDCEHVACTEVAIGRQLQWTLFRFVFGCCWLLLVFGLLWLVSFEIVSELVSE
jgi:hypothetical protein